MFKLKYILTVSFIALFFLTTKAETPPPDWSVVANDYANSMIVTGALKLDYIESIDPNDKVAAFMEGECRGVANLVYDENSDRHLFYLIIYSNSISGTVNFKVYDESQDSQFDVPATVEFSINGKIGSTEAPYIFSNTELSNESKILSFNIYNQVGETVFDGNNINIVMPFGTDLTTLVANYTTSDHATVKVNDVIQTSGNTANNFANSVEYWVQSIDETSEQTYTVSVSYAPVPTDILLSSNTVSELSPIGTIIGILSYKGSNPDYTHTYTLVAGEGDDDNRSFAIENNKLKTNINLDYDNQTEHSIRVKIDNGNGGVLEKKFTILVTDDHPPVVEDEVLTIKETIDISTFSHQVKATDADENTVLTYAIFSGNLNDAFAISSTTGILTLNKKLDYENTTEYPLEVKVSDGSNITIGHITIHVVDENDEAPIVESGKISLLEDSPLGEFYKVIASDADVTSQFKDLKYDIFAGNEEAKFSIDATTGKLSLIKPLDFETTDSYTLDVSVGDGVHTTNQSIYINVINIDDDPPVANDTVLYIDETVEVGSEIYRVSATDIDENSILIYTISSGNIDKTFEINSINGALRLNKNLDYEKTIGYALRVNVSDGVNNTNCNIDIYINDINDEVPVFNDTTFSISEFTALDDFSKQLKATDVDENSNLYFEFEDADSKIFNLSSDGELTLTDYPDFETDSLYKFTVLVSDGDNEGRGTLTIKVIDEEDAIIEANSLFSPNGDGINDYWKIKNVHLYRNAHLYIYDNAGQLVYDCVGYKNDWDGTCNGKALPMGVYVYKMVFPNCNDCKYVGVISLVK